VERPIIESMPSFNPSVNGLYFTLANKLNVSPVENIISVDAQGRRYVLDILAWVRHMEKVALLSDKNGFSLN